MIESVYFGQILSTVITTVVFLIISYIIKRLTKSYARNSHLSEHRTNLISKYINFFMMTLYAVIIIAIWGLEAKDLLQYLGGILTVIGVAFFAQWSILSNITSGIILFFSFPFP